MEDNNRASGRTTRLTDKYIQEFFNNGTTGYIADHYGDHRANTMLYKRICFRLDLEHPHISYTRAICGRYPILYLNKK